LDTPLYVAIPRYRRVCCARLPKWGRLSTQRSICL